MSIVATLFAGIGIGSIIAAAIGWRVAILNLRQASINALRDDLATFLKELEVIYYTPGNVLSLDNPITLPERTKQLQDARVAYLFIYRRILLRLNGTDPLYLELAQKLEAFDKSETRIPDQDAITDLVKMSQNVLKRDEEDAAWWPLTRPIRWWRDRRGTGSQSRPRSTG